MGKVKRILLAGLFFGFVTLFVPNTVKAEAVAPTVVSSSAISNGATIIGSRGFTGVAVADIMEASKTIPAGGINKIYRKASKGWTDFVSDPKGNTTLSAIAATTYTFSLTEASSGILSNVTANNKVFDATANVNPTIFRVGSGDSADTTNVWASGVAKPRLTIFLSRMYYTLEKSDEITLAAKDALNKLKDGDIFKIVNGVVSNVGHVGESSGATVTPAIVAASVLSETSISVSFNTIVTGLSEASFTVTDSTNTTQTITILDATKVDNGTTNTNYILTLGTKLKDNQKVNVSATGSVNYGTTSVTYYVAQVVGPTAPVVNATPSNGSTYVDAQWLITTKNSATLEVAQQWTISKIAGAPEGVSFEGKTITVLSTAPNFSAIVKLVNTSNQVAYIEIEKTTTVDKSALQTAITNANASASAVWVAENDSLVTEGALWVPQADKNTFTAAIASAQVVLNNTSAAQATVDTAVNSLAQAQTTFASKVKVKGPTPVDKTALQAAIDKANTSASSVFVATSADTVTAGALWVLQANKDAFTSAITSAQTVLGNTSATQANVTAAVQALALAQSTFTSNANVGTKGQLSYKYTATDSKVGTTKFTLYSSKDGYTNPVKDVFYVVAVYETSGKLINVSGNSDYIATPVWASSMFFPLDRAVKCILVIDESDTNGLADRFEEYYNSGSSSTHLPATFDVNGFAPEDKGHTFIITPKQQ